MLRPQSLLTGNTALPATLLQNASPLLQRGGADAGGIRASPVTSSLNIVVDKLVLSTLILIHSAWLQDPSHRCLQPCCIQGCHEQVGRAGGLKHLQGATDAGWVNTGATSMKHGTLHIHAKQSSYMLQVQVPKRWQDANRLVAQDDQNERQATLPQSWLVSRYIPLPPCSRGSHLCHR